MNEIIKEENADTQDLVFKFSTDIADIKDIILRIINSTIFSIKKDVVGFRIDREESECMKGVEKNEILKAESLLTEMITGHLDQLHLVIDH